MTATGQIRAEFINPDEYYSYYLDSIFPINISFSGEKQNFVPGDWITAEGEAYIILPRGSNIRS